MADPTIRVKRSSVAGRVPSVNQVPLGELALNTYDGQLYASKNVGLGTTVVVINPWIVGTGTDSYNAFFIAGNAGIGTTTPGSKLTVAGDANISGVVTANAGFNIGISSAGTIITSGPLKTLNFVGVGNTFLYNNTTKTIDISIQGGGGGTIGISSAGNRIGTGFTDLNFIGTGVSIVGSGSTVSIRIEPGLVGAAKSVTSFTATTSQTTFNVNYSQGQENIFLNGVRLSESQYTATNGSTVVLNDPATDGDSVDIVVYLRGSDPNRNTMVTLLPPFNGATTAFTMFQGTTSYLFEPIDERQIVVSLGGVIQQPGVAYTVGTGSSIFFSAAPGIAVSCFITALFSNTVGIPTDAVKLNKQVYTPSGIQTSFTVTDGYRSGYLEVYRNGLRLVDGSDFTASNGTTFDLITPANGGDVVDIVAYKTLNISYAEFAGLSTNVDGGYGSLTNLQVSGISTLGNVLIGAGGTDLLVKGNARVTGILTIGQGSITLNGLTDTISGSTFLNSTNLSITGVGTISNGSITNLTGTAGTVTTLRSTTLNADTGNIVTGVTTNFTSTNGSITNLTGTSSTITTLRSTTGNFTTGNIVTGVTTNFNATNVVITGVTTVSAGTTALPSISPSGDSNTGIFFPAADTIAASTGGTSRIAIDSSGNINIDNNTIFVDAVNNNVGIATNAPLAKLQINDSGDIRLQGGNPGKILFFSTGNGVSQNATLEVSNDGATTNTGVFKFSTRNTGGTLAERMSITESGVQINDSHDIRLQGSAPGKILFFSTSNGVSQNATIEVSNDGLTANTGVFKFSTRNTGGTLAERMRITDSELIVAKSSSDNVTPGFSAGAGGIVCARNDLTVLTVSRITDDGTLISLRQGNPSVEEGTISVSGTTISYNGAHLSRWSQLPSGAERTEILRGSVLSNINEMCEWGNEDNEQLNRMKVSEVEGDKNVSGVFQAWDDDDDTYINDFYCAMTGDFIIRIAEGITVECGDLLMSAGDGTAKPQDDDIIRSKTIAKVTSTNISCTYEDGSYCVPCVLMAC